nr:MAG TPA: hypothetical protein [Caudoviricetes sp.]
MSTVDTGLSFIPGVCFITPGCFIPCPLLRQTAPRKGPGAVGGERAT